MSVTSDDQVVGEKDAYAFWENRATLTGGTQELDISRWTTIKSSSRSDLKKYLAKEQKDFSNEFWEQFNRAYDCAPVHWGPGNWNMCYLCNELDFDGLTRTRPVYRYDHPGKRRTTRSWAYLLALYHECCGCKILVNFIKDKWWSPPTDLTSPIQDSAIEAQQVVLANRYGERKNTDESWFRAVLCTITRVGGVKHEGLFASSPMQQTPRMSKSLVAIDLYFNCSILKSWVRTCDQRHTCLDSHFAMSTNDSVRLIDVNKMQVIESSDLRQAAALSYVWGPPEKVSIRLLKENKGALMSEKGLQAVQDRLPQTICDAIAICRMMNLPYLWCDMFCIVQDDASDLEVQLRMMQKIYKHSYLTMICAYGDNANAGIPGSPHSPRKTPQWSHVENGVRFLEVYRSMDDLKKTVWDTRAWTYQEKHLSQRMLLFTADQAYFQCQQDFVPSEVIRQSQTGFRSDNLYYLKVFQNLRLFQTAGHLLETYCYFVETYSRRKLTKREDSINALAGILAQFTEDLGWQFHFGLPLPVLSQALCWYERRTALRKSDGKFPSWTWASYIGTSQPCSISYARIGYVDLYVQSKAKWFRSCPKKAKAAFVSSPVIASATYPSAGRSKMAVQGYPQRIREAFQRVFDLMTPSELNFLICTETDAVDISGEDARRILADNVNDIATTSQDEAWCPISVKNWDESTSYGCYCVMSGEYTDIYQQPFVRKQCVWTLLVETDPRGVSKRIRPMRFSAEAWSKQKLEKRVLLLM